MECPRLDYIFNDKWRSYNTRSWPQDRSYFDSIFTELDQFEPGHYMYDLYRMKTLSGKKCALVRTWTDPEDNQLIFYILKDMFAIAFLTDSHLIVGKQNKRDFIYTPAFVFDKPASSEINMAEFPSLSLSEIKELLKKTTLDYV